MHARSFVRSFACSLPGRKHFVFLFNYERNRSSIFSFFFPFPCVTFGDGELQLHGCYYLRGVKKSKQCVQRSSATTRSLFLHLAVITRRFKSLKMHLTLFFCSFVFDFCFLPYSIFRVDWLLLCCKLQHLPRVHFICLQFAKHFHFQARKM